MKKRSFLLVLCLRKQAGDGSSPAALDVDLAGRGFQKQAREDHAPARVTVASGTYLPKSQTQDGLKSDSSPTNDGETSMSPSCRVVSPSRLKRFQLPVSQAGSFPAGCLIPGESAQVCLLRPGAARYSRKDHRKAVDAAPSTGASTRRIELAVIEGSKP
jgi:hypothetical protein